MNLTTGEGNTATGWCSLFSATTGSFNTGVGAGTLALNSGDENTATGTAALCLNTTGFQNTASGVRALLNNTDGAANVAMGVSALLNNTSGFQNTAIGFQALDSNTTGNQNTAIGLNAGHAVSTATNVICIGDAVAGENVSNSCYIGHIFAQSSSGGTGVFVNAAGKLGTNTSSRRFKEDIKPMDKASEVILALKPVTFRYKRDIDPQGFPQFGLVAEDVEEVNPALVVRDGEGKVNTVRYDQVNAMLLNEFLKEHRKVQDLEKGMVALTAQLKEQAAQIQKVSAHLEMSKPATSVVLK